MIHTGKEDNQSALDLGVADQVLNNWPLLFRNRGEGHRLPTKTNLPVFIFVPQV